MDIGFDLALLTGLMVVLECMLICLAGRVPHRSRED